MRIINSAKNMVFGISSQLTSALMAFITRTIFINILGVGYLGVQGLFSNILSMLSLANLGFGTAIIYSLYKPLKENNYNQIKAYMNMYKKFYRYVAIVVLIIGLTIIPFLPKFINMNQGIRENLIVIYIMFLLESSISYLCVYKQSILIANQQNYEISKIHTYFIVISNTIQILMLILLRAYIPVLAMQLVCRIIENIMISRRADLQFPLLKDKNIQGNLSKKEKKELYKNVYSMLLYKISGTVINSTDNVIISYFVGTIYVGLYSNYLLIISTIRTFISYIFSSMTASIGNLVVSNDKKKKEEIFDNVFFMSFWIYGFFAIALYVLMNSFIKLWIGNKYLLDNFTVLIIVINFYTTGMQNASTTYRDTTGMFSIGKYRPLIAAIINLIVSVLLAPKLKIAGVLLGTIISRLSVYFWFDPYIIYKNIFKCSSKKYFLKYCIYTNIIIIIGYITYKICGLVNLDNKFGNFILDLCICGIIPNFIIMCIFHKTKEYKYLFNTIMYLYNKVKQKQIMIKV